jgi:hypothetical protein
MPDLFDKNKKLTIIEYGAKSQTNLSWASLCKNLDLVSFLRRFWH